MMEIMYCPKCKKNTEFYDIDDGPDVDDDTLTYTSYNCEVCNLHLDGKNQNWYNSEDVSCYLHVERAKPYMTSIEYTRITKDEKN
jgi:hypothetical protein